MRIRFFLIFVFLGLTIYNIPSFAAVKESDKKSVSVARDISKDSVFVGVIKDVKKDAGDPSGQFGVLRSADSTANELEFFFKKKDNVINSKAVGKKVKIFWSWQVDTSLDEANTFSLIDSIQILNQ